MIVEHHRIQMLNPMCSHLAEAGQFMPLALDLLACLSGVDLRSNTPPSTKDPKWSNYLEPETSMAIPKPPQQLLHMLQNPTKDFTFSVAQDNENQQTHRQPIQESKPHCS